MAITAKHILKKAIYSFVSNEELNRIAYETGFVKRLRKVEVARMFWALIFSFGGGKARSFEDIKKTYHLSPGSKKIARSSFYERLNGRLALFMRKILDLVISRLKNPPDVLRKTLKAFKDLVVIDSTLIRLNDLLGDVYPATGLRGGNKPIIAQAKVQVVMSATAAAPRFLNLVEGKRYEGKTIEIGEWVEGRLLLADLGYFKFQYFLNIHNHKGFFISRVNSTFNPFVLDENHENNQDGENGKNKEDLDEEKKEPSISELGSRFKEVTASYSKDKLDFNVQLCKDRPTSGKKLAVMRVVCIWNPKKARYNCYLTNIPAYRLKSEDIARTYSARWEIEMIFKELKSYYKLDKFRTKKACIVEILVYTALLSFILSRHVLLRMRKGYGILPSRSPERRFTAVFIRLSSTILHDLFALSKYKTNWNEHDKYLLKEMLDPNRKRQQNLNILRN